MKTSILALITLLPTLIYSKNWGDNIPPYRVDENLPQQVNIVNIWATWCPVCRQELPVLSDFAERHPDIGVIGIATEKQEKVADFLRTTPLDYPVYYYTDDITPLEMRFADENGIVGIPYTVIDAPKCHFRKAFAGFVSQKQLEEAVTQAQQQCGYQ